MGFDSLEAKVNRPERLLPYMEFYGTVPLGRRLS